HSLLKATPFRPFGPGRRRFSVVGMGWISGFCFGFVGQDVVTICMTGARRIATGGTNVVSEPART
ncbi:hypothetical protein ACUYVE_004611, partial [Salmonella enterica subsp. enterica serovar Enteritidis]